MADLYRKDGRGRYGTFPNLLQRIFGTSPLVANATTDYLIGAPPTEGFLGRGAVSSNTVAVDADGTILASLCKYDASATAVVPLTNTVSLEAAGITSKISTQFTFLSTLTDAQRRFDTGDTLLLRVVNNSAAIDTQPTELTVAAEIFLKD